MEVNQVSLSTKPGSATASTVPESENARAALDLETASAETDSETLSDDPGRRFAQHCRRINVIKHFMRHNNFPNGLPKREEKAIRKIVKLNRFTLGEGVLWYNHPTLKRSLLVVEDEKQKERVLWQAHTAKASGHFGINATQHNAATSGYWWNGLSTDVAHLVANCDTCLTTPRPQPIKPAERKPILIKEPLHMVDIDVIGPLPETQSGSKYVLAMTDYFTKFVDFVALPDKSAAAMSRGLMTFIYRWGAPQRVLCDQGRDFVNALNDQLSNTYSIKRLVSSSYRPHTNTTDEASNHNQQNTQTNKAFKSRLKKLGAEKANWDLHLEEAAFSLRTQKPGSAKIITPFYLMFNRKARLPAEIQDQPIHTSVDEVMAENNVATYLAKTEIAKRATHEKLCSSPPSPESQPTPAKQQKTTVYTSPQKQESTNPLSILKAGDKIIVQVSKCPPPAPVVKQQALLASEVLCDIHQMVAKINPRVGCKLKEAMIVEGYSVK